MGNVPAKKNRTRGEQTLRLYGTTHFVDTMQVGLYKWLIILQRYGALKLLF